MRTANIYLVKSGGSRSYVEIDRRYKGKKVKVILFHTNEGIDWQGYIKLEEVLKRVYTVRETGKSGSCVINLPIILLGKHIIIKLENGMPL